MTTTLFNKDNRINDTLIIRLINTGLFFDNKLVQIIDDANKAVLSISIDSFGLQSRYKLPLERVILLESVNKRIEELGHLYDFYEVGEAVHQDEDITYMIHLNKCNTTLMELCKELKNPESLHPVKIFYDLLDLINLAESETGYSDKLMESYKKLSVLLMKY